MRVVVQRVSQASVTINNKIYNKISNGFLLLVGFEEGDGADEIKYLVHKISQLRVFSDSEGKMNLSIAQVQGEILSISQFTLYAALKKGNRPSFIAAQNPEEAKKNYEIFNKTLSQEGIVVREGVFGADMQVALTNDGPVTIIYDTDNLK
ncbi:MAG: D-aminoacyl-tRNA deacylase [Liquorilactobacillus mali]|uniref:D-aminoacyl-tRNA deacylase n=1 Tax=Liquorilactobacillus mali TaxID=1618 RepID=UPI0039EB2F92